MREEEVSKLDVSMDDPLLLVNVLNGPKELQNETFGFDFLYAFSLSNEVV